MAINLKLKKKCHIVAPDWLNVGMFVFSNSSSFFFYAFFRFAFISIDFTCVIDYLQTRLTMETSQLAYSELPFRFAEIAKVILDVLVLFFIFFFLSQNAHNKILLVWS